MARKPSRGDTADWRKTIRYTGDEIEHLEMEFMRARERGEAQDVTDYIRKCSLGLIRPDPLPLIID